MREIEGDIWDYHAKGNWITITTNPIQRADGALIMGRGVAQQAKERFPELPYVLGRLVASGGNVPYKLDRWKIVSFPVKHHWQQPADTSLIVQSAEMIRDLCQEFQIRPLYMVRPGCGNGGLSWVHVKPLIQAAFYDEDFVIVERG